MATTPCDIRFGHENSVEGKIDGEEEVDVRDKARSVGKSNKTEKVIIEPTPMSDERKRRERRRRERAKRRAKRVITLSCNSTSSVMENALVHKTVHEAKISLVTQDNLEEKVKSLDIRDGNQPVFQFKKLTGFKPVRPLGAWGDQERMETVKNPFLADKLRKPNENDEKKLVVNVGEETNDMPNLIRNSPIFLQIGEEEAERQMREFQAKVASNYSDVEPESFDKANLIDTLMFYSVLFGSTLNESGISDLILFARAILFAEPSTANYRLALLNFINAAQCRHGSTIYNWDVEYFRNTMSQWFEDLSEKINKFGKDKGMLWGSIQLDEPKGEDELEIVKEV